MKITHFLFFIFSFSIIHAQDDADSQDLGRAFMEVVLESEFGFPTTEFKSEIDKSFMWGKGIAAFYRFKNVPVDAGIRIGDFSYDHVRRDFAIGSDDDFEQVTKNKIWVWYGAARVYPELKLPFPLYFEASAGVRHFRTKTFSKVRGVLFSDGDEESRFDEEGLHSDWGPAFGGAIGIKIVLEETFGTSIDLQIGYRQSAPGQFYVRNDLSEVQEFPLDNYVARRASLSMLSIKLGISVLGRSFLN